jgi:hypothetical protein
MRTREELAWAAGLFEGEGTFNLGPRKTPRHRQIRAGIKMTDLDRLQAFQSATGLGRIYGPFQQKPHHKAVWAWRVQSFENVQALIAMLWCWLGSRRRARATELLLESRNARESTDWIWRTITLDGEQVVMRSYGRVMS